MSVSLTSSGLYLEPRVYTDGSGVNYGTPKFVSGATSLGGGSWAGLYNYSWTETLYGHTTRFYKMESESNVSSSKGGVFTSEYPNSISRRGGGLNADDRCRNRTLLFLFNWRYNCKPSERSSLSYLYEIFRKFIYSSIKWKCICPRFLRIISNRGNNLFNNNWTGRQKVLLNKIFLNLHLVKEVA